MEQGLEVEVEQGLGLEVEVGQGLELEVEQGLWLEVEVGGSVEHTSELKSTVDMSYVVVCLMQSK